MVLGTVDNLLGWRVRRMQGGEQARRESGLM